MTTHALSNARRRQRAAERKVCPVHAYQLHGREAEELRAGIEALLAGYRTVDDEESVLTEVVRDLQDLLDEVDARDSLAYLERNKLTGRRAALRVGNGPNDGGRGS